MFGNPDARPRNRLLTQTAIPLQIIKLRVFFDSGCYWYRSCSSPLTSGVQIRLGRI